MAIHYFAEETQVPAIKKREISRWIKAVAATYGKTTGEISYIFCNDSRILDVNRQYLQHDYYTDIITFDYTEGDRISGDIFISLDTVKSNAQEYGQRFEDELHRIIIHGILHLCGIKDKGEKERQQMTRGENQALEQLSVKQAEAQKENP